MEDKFLAAAKTEEALTDEQLQVVEERGWQAFPHRPEGSPGTFLFRATQSEEEAVREYADLELDDRLPGLSGIVSRPLPSSVSIINPAQASVFMKDLLDASKPKGKSDAPPAEPGGGETKPEKPSDTPPKEAASTTETFPAVPEYLWKSLKPETQEEFAKKLVEYAASHRDRSAYGGSFDDAALFAHLAESERPDLAKRILEQKHGISTAQANFEEQRLGLMVQAVASAAEVNEHLKRWTTLSKVVVPFLIISSVVAAIFVYLLFGLVSADHINGWEMAVLAFVFALMAVSPATLLLIGRPLKGLDEWSPGKQEAKAEAAKEDPGKDKGKTETKADK